MDRRNLTLLTDLYELTMMQGYFERQENETVVFDMFFRSNPNKAGYSIAAGLDQVIQYIKNLNFSYDDVEYEIYTSEAVGETASARVPISGNYSISGDNFGTYIITVEKNWTSVKFVLASLRTGFLLVIS